MRLEAKSSPAVGVEQDRHEVVQVQHVCCRAAGRPSGLTQEGSSSTALLNRDDVSVGPSEDEETSLLSGASQRRQTNGSLDSIFERMESQQVCPPLHFMHSRFENASGMESQQVCPLEFCDDRHATCKPLAARMVTTIPSSKGYGQAEAPLHLAASAPGRYAPLRISCREWRMMVSMCVIVSTACLSMLCLHLFVLSH